MLSRAFALEVASCEHRKCYSGLLGGKGVLVNTGNVMLGFWLGSGLL